MIRQHPVKRKRTEFNLKPRLLDPTKMATQQETVPVQAVPVQTPPVQAEVVATQPIADTVAQKIEQTVKPIEGAKSDPYGISQITARLFGGQDRKELLPLLHKAFAAAQQGNDEFHASIFQGALAANESNENPEKAAECYRKAFDLAEQQGRQSTGFLQSMIWDLFVSSKGNESAAELMDRARAMVQGVVSAGTGLERMVTEILGKLKQIPGFRQQYTGFLDHQQQKQQKQDKVVFRPSRLSETRALLLFPRKPFQSARETEFLRTGSGSDRAGFFVHFPQSGILVNPGSSCLGEFFRLGLAPEDVQTLIFTADSPIDSALFDILANCYDQKVSSGGNVAKIRIVAPVAMAEPLFRVCSRDGFELTILSENSTKIELSSGAELQVQPGLWQWQHAQVPLVVRRIDPSEWWLKMEPNPKSVSIYSVQNPEDFFRAVALAEKNPCVLTVFDIPDSGVEYLHLAEGVRSHLQKPIAFSASTLICDLGQAAFFDTVKAVDSPAESSWTPMDQLAWAADEQPGSEGLYYFQQGLETDFQENRSIVIENDRFHRHCRKGLFFNEK